MDLSQKHLSFAPNLHSESDSPEEFSSNRAATTTTTTLDDLLASHGTQDGEMDMELEWLSTFVEDCLTSTGNCLPLTTTQMHPPKNVQTTSPPLPASASAKQKQADHNVKKTTPFFLHRIAIPGKARSKRKRRRPASSFSSSVLNLRAARTQLRSCWFRQDHQSFTDPPLLQVQQAYWLADSELIVNPNIINTSSKNQEQQLSSSETETETEAVVAADTSGGQGQGQQQRRCSHCLSQRTPQWRAGPLGPKTLCNACGVRYKSGRLLPEYRPAKSPTFVSYKHSNSHKKVMEMRMALLQSNS